jgi:hypothetical protein
MNQEFRSQELQEFRRKGLEIQEVGSGQLPSDLRDA